MSASQCIKRSKSTLKSTPNRLTNSVGKRTMFCPTKFTWLFIVCVLYHLPKSAFLLMSVLSTRLFSWGVLFEELHGRAKHEGVPVRDSPGHGSRWRVH